MIVFTILLILLLPVLVIIRESGRLTPLVVTAFGLTPVLLGYAELDAQNDTNTALLYCAAAICMFVGYVVHHARRRARLVAIDLPNESSSRTAPTYLAFVWVVVILTFYHFFAGGVPLLSVDVETARFDFTSSGLFGIPGRMFLFGLPFVVLLVNVAAARRLAPVSSTVVYVVWGAYAAASLLGGFKGGLVTVLTTMLLARSIAGSPLPLRRFLVGWRSLVIVAALLYGGTISLRYRSLGLTSPNEVIPYLTARVTVSAAEPGYLVFSKFGLEGSEGQHFAEDIRYFLNKYLPFLPLGDEPAFPFEKRVSAALSHTVISSKAFIVPVTVGAFPELVANIGIGWALLVMAIVGVGLSHLVVKAQSSQSGFRSAVYGLCVYCGQIYILNGDLIYAVLNCVLVCAFLSAVYYVCRFVCGVEREPLERQPRLTPA